MRRLTQALLALAGVIIGTGVASAAPVLHLSGWKATAGKPETFTITRVGGNGPATVTFRTTDGTAAAPVDYTAAAQTIIWRNGQFTATITIPTFVNLAKAGQNVAFTATITGYGGTSSATGLIVEPAAPVPPPPPPTQTCPDGSVVLATATCPLPVPVASEPVISPNGIKGEFDIADNFDVQATLIPTLETVPAGLDPVGAFRFTCLAGKLAKDDPIALPGQPGMSHLHQFFGNTGTNASSTYQSLRTTGGSTCTRTTDVSGQRTAYWMPAMLDGAGNAVKPDKLLTYYKRLPATHPACGAPDATHVGFCTPLPNGLKFIYGYNMATGLGGPNASDVLLTNSSDGWRMGYDCVDVNDNSLTGTKPTIADIVATGKCPVGAWLRAFITLPECWDGVHLDTADHRSHMVPPAGAGIASAGDQRSCPLDHPYVIPEIAIQAFYSTDANFEAGLWHLSSDEMLPGFIVGPGSPVKAGTSLHFDYDEAWSPVVKNLWETGCIDGHFSCNVGELGNGQTLNGMAQYTPFPSHVLVPLTNIP